MRHDCRRSRRPAGQLPALGRDNLPGGEGHLIGLGDDGTDLSGRETADQVGHDRLGLVLLEGGEAAVGDDDLGVLVEDGLQPYLRFRWGLEPSVPSR